jgi:hypothetical protein
LINYLLLLINNSKQIHYTMKHFVISGIGCASQDKNTEKKKWLDVKKFEFETDPGELEEQGEWEEWKEDENVIPMLCYGLIMMVLITLMIAVLFIPCYKLLTGDELNENSIFCAKQILVSVLIGEVSGVLFSICCVLIQGFWAMGARSLDGGNKKLKDV